MEVGVFLSSPPPLQDTSSSRTETGVKEEEGQTEVDVLKEAVWFLQEVTITNTSKDHREEQTFHLKRRIPSSTGDIME